MSNRMCIERLDRIVAMLTRLGQRGYSFQEEPAAMARRKIDTDFDTDSDPDGKRESGTPTRGSTDGTDTAGEPQAKTLC